MATRANVAFMSRDSSILYSAADAVERGIFGGFRRFKRTVVCAGSHFHIERRKELRSCLGSHQDGRHRFNKVHCTTACVPPKPLGTDRLQLEWNSSGVTIRRDTQGYVRLR